MPSATRAKAGAAKTAKAAIRALVQQMAMNFLIWLLLSAAAGRERPDPAMRLPSAGLGLSLARTTHGSKDHGRAPLKLRVRHGKGDRSRRWAWTMGRKRCSP